MKFTYGDYIWWLKLFEKIVSTALTKHFVSYIQRRKFEKYIYLQFKCTPNTFSSNNF